jgi:iron complex transport system substrate-binding protein
MRLRSSLLAATHVATLTACAGAGAGDGDGDPAAAPGDSDAPAEASAGFPLTVEHAYGETTIEAPPERISTVAWANHEVPLALGVVPVGMAAASWGDDDGDGVLPWVEAELEALGADVPVLFDETDGIDVEAVADTQPDLILAAYSGLTQEEYDTLSRIAPVVAYPELAWATSVQEMIALSSRAMGMEAQGQQLIADLEDEIATAFDDHPELTDQRVMFAYLDPNDLSTIGFYTTHDTRPAFLHDAGLAVPEIVADRSAGSDAFFETVSAEEADRLDDVDLLITYGDPDGSTLDLYRDDPLLSRIPAIERGSVVVLEDSTPLAAAANPSPLSIRATLDTYVELLAEAAAR